MPKYIDADKFLQDNAYFADRDFVNPKYDDTLRDLIDRAPAADVEPVRHGRWVYNSDGVLCCSKCGEFALQRLKLQFKIKSFEAPFVKSNCCPNCGAKMDKEADA